MITSTARFDGSRALHYIQGDGSVTDVPDPLAGYDISAAVVDPQTGAVTAYPAVVSGNSFTIPERAFPDDEARAEFLRCATRWWHDARGR